MRLQNHTAASPEETLFCTILAQSLSTQIQHLESLPAPAHFHLATVDTSASGSRSSSPSCAVATQGLLQPGCCQALTWPHRNVLGVRAENIDAGNPEDITQELTLFLCWFSPYLQFSSAHANDQKPLLLDRDGKLKVSSALGSTQGELRLGCGICNGFPVCLEMG